MSSKTFSKRRYQPAAEFDDVTLARKREYWRSKKREQRARKSSAKKKIGNENLGLCMSVVSDEPALQIPKVDNDPSLHNHDISCKLEDSDAPRNSSSSGLSVSECNVTMVPCQKERWFQKTKLNHVLPKFPETSTNSLKGVMGNKKIKSSFTGSSNTDAKTEALCPIGHSVTTTCIEFHSNSTHTQKTKTGMSSLNGKQLATSPQSHVSMVLPVHNNQNKPQNCLKPLTSAECKVHKEQSLVHSHISKRRTCAFASKHNTTVAMTEEEMAAKRRENWRIKKREQRAKRAAKLAQDREGSLGQGQSSCIVNASSPANSKALRGINFNSANPKCLNQQSFGVKCIGSRTQLHVQDTKPNHASLSSGILQPSSSKSKVPQFAHTQKRHCQEPTRKSFLGASKVESPEDRHARQKEYWRIKKREQRARLSTAVKAQLKEQSALKHCGRRYHNSFNQMCGVQVNRAGAFASSSDKIGGFIKEDGTVTVSTSKTTSESHDYSNVKCVRKVRLQVQVSSPLYSDAQQVTKLVSAPCNVSKAHHNSLVKSSLAGGAVMGSMTVTIQSETPTEEERITRLREYWRIKKREQRASRAARLGNGLLRSKVSVLKQREQNKKSNKRDSITSSITKTVAPTSAPNPIKEEHINPPIHAVFSIPEITPCISVIDGKPSPCPTLKSHIEPPAAANHHATTLQAVASMKKLLEESVSIPEDNNATKMHVKCENEPLRLTKDDLTSEDAKPNITLQQNDLLECDVSEDTSLKDFKMSPQAFPFEDTSHHKSRNFCQEAADGSHDFSPVAVQPQCINTQKFSDYGADPMQSCPSQASQKQQLGESDELQRKREYWRLMKRQQRARKANKDAGKDANKTEEEKIARLREYWMIKKREQRASQAARLGNGLLRSKVSVLKQREQNKKSNKRDSIISSITKTVAPTSTPTHIQEHINPPIHAVFSIPEITPCISVKDGKPSPCPSLESHIEPPAAANHHATTLQAVASMKKLLEESVSTPEDNNATEMHVKCENEPLLLIKDDLLTSEDAKTDVTLQQIVLLECDVSEDTSLKDIKMSPQAFPFEDTSHHKPHNFCQEAADGSHALSPVAVQPQCRSTQKFSDDGADPKQSCPSQALQKQQLGESDELQRKREYWRLMKRQQRARKANKDAGKDANKTQEERIARLREYWMIKKREQRASQAARLGNGLLRSKVSVLKQREQNKKSNKRESITSSINKTVGPSSAPTRIQKNINPPIHAVFSIPEITPCISVKDGKPSPCPSLESHIEPPAAVNHHATTLQAVASMKMLLEESVCTPEDNNAIGMHVKCENEPLLLTKDDLTSEDAKPNVTLQQNVLLECDVSEDTSLKDIKMSPQALTFKDTSHHKSNNLQAADESHALSPVVVQPQCINTQKFSDDGADHKQPCPSQASQKQQLGESDELQRKREYWRLMKRQQRAKKANKDAVLRSLAPQTQTPSTTLLLAMSQDASICRQIPIQKQTRRCTKPAGPQAQLTDKSRTNRSQTVAMPNPQVDPQEVIRRRRMQWRIKKQKQRARKAANERKLRQTMLPPQGQTSGQNITSFCSVVVQSIKSEDQLGYLAEPCQTALKEESSFAPNDVTEGPLSQAEWRNVYLMDSDPVNLLLVCMVCGEQQYSLSVEAAKAHIEEVHPNTISLGDFERQGILDAWDKQVAVREHSITHQLQQRCRAPIG
ncbi:uncharacterized protein si:dkey-28a3.2 isoform X2 [Ctenopharyngodon idella]|uniref:uncharacterized protein si:dkey-28a3.2 isoform X2 n=1 Tax=Ctenopharyngodon idella TaxID=7959 RepID=UPI00222EDF7E|nr:uncharacterized protein si:dkey-28a3.2 isoform X2 [Ctenopharyngodon idella]